MSSNLQNKARRTYMFNGVANNDVGKDGDFAVVNSPKESALYVKNKGIWYRSSLLEKPKLGNNKYKNSKSKQCWVKTGGGFISNNNTAVNYYTQIYNGYFFWSNTTSNPTNIPYTDSYAYFYKAPKAGKLTKICFTGRSLRTDPFKIYVYKGSPSNGDVNFDCTLIGTSSTITPPATTQTTVSDTIITLNNKFEEGDKLWVWLKKDSTSGTQTIYFIVTIEGEYY